MYRKQLNPLTARGDLVGAPARVPAQVAPEHRDLDRELRLLHQRWVTVVDGCFENEMECGDGEPADALRKAWAHALMHSADVKRELDAFEGHPLHDHLMEHHLARLAHAAGLMRPGHTVAEGLGEIRQMLAAVQPMQVEQPGWLARRRREIEVDRLMRAARGW